MIYLWWMFCNLLDILWSLNTHIKLNYITNCARMSFGHLEFGSEVFALPEWEYTITATSRVRKCWMHDMFPYVKSNDIPEHKAIQQDWHEGRISTFTHGSWTLTWLRGAQGNNHSSEDEDDDDVRSHFDHMKRLHIHFFTCPLQCPVGELSNVFQPVRLCAAAHIERMVWTCAWVYVCK